MDWVHCNKCLKALISNRDIRLYITTCGCIFCEKCLGEFKDKQFKCCICDKMAQATKLGSTMPPEIADFFKEPVEVLSSMITVAINKAGKIVDFQKKHRTRLTKAHSMQMEKMRSVYEEYKKVQGHLAELSKDNEILQRKCAAYENQIKNYQNGGAAIFRHPNTASPMAGPIPQHKFEFLLSQSSQGDGSDIQTPRITMPRFGKMTPTNDQNFSTPASTGTMSSLAYRVNQNLGVRSSGDVLTPGRSDPSPQSGRPAGSSITAFLKALSGKS